MKLSLTALVFLLLAATASQTLMGANHKARQYNDYADEISLDKAVSQARRQYNGRVLSAETDERNGRGTHKIRILTDEGRVRRLRIDKQTGEYIRPSRR